MKGLPNQGLKAYVSEYLSVVADEQNLSVRQRKNRTYAFNRIQAFLAERDFTFDTTREYLNQLRTKGLNGKPWQQNSINAEILLIRAFLTYLQKRKIISPEENWGQMIEKSKHHPKHRELPTFADAVKIIIAGTKEGNIYRDGLLFTLDTGVRYCELRSIRKNGVFLQASIPYVVVHAKMGDEHEIDIPYQHIDKIRERKDIDEIFPLRADTANDLLKEGARKLNLPKITLHDLRRIGADNLDDNGASTRSVQTFLRHKSITTTERYISSGLRKRHQIGMMYHDRNRSSLPLESILSMIENMDKRIIGNNEKLVMNVIEKNEKGMTIKFSAK